MMKVMLLNIGSEILNGTCPNTNAEYISRRLVEIGVFPVYQISCRDDHDDIIKSLQFACSQADVIILTGGLGPTSDDLTREAIAKCFGLDVRYDKKTERDIRDKIKDIHQNAIDISVRQAVALEKSRQLKAVGTAPGIFIRKEGLMVFALPGVPWEMKKMLDEQVVPVIKRSLRSDAKYYFEDIRTFGTLESEIQYIIENGNIGFSNASVSYLPAMGEVTIRVSASDKSYNTARQGVKEIVDKLRSLLANKVTVLESNSLEDDIANKLSKKKLTISSAESCTGGKFVSRITSHPGSSMYFIGSVVAYSNEVKTRVLGVDESLIAAKGAVSYEVAEAMAYGCRKLFSSDIAVSSTGIAGPTGATRTKPLGLVYTAISTDRYASIKENILRGGREQIIFRATQIMYKMLFDYLNTV
jgi:nicotinamide-nucleotide amidase